MDWVDITVNLFVGVISGLFVSVLTNLFVIRPLNKNKEYKNKLKELYLDYKILESGNERFDIKNLNKLLNETRIIVKTDKDLNDAFYEVDVCLSNLLRILVSGGNANYDYNNEAYSDFIQLFDIKMRYLTIRNQEKNYLYVKKSS